MRRLKPTGYIPSPIKGKKRTEYSAVTYCDFGEAGRRASIGVHYTKETAERQFKRLCRIYRDGPAADGWSVWTELLDSTVLCGTRPEVYT